MILNLEYASLSSGWRDEVGVIMKTKSSEPEEDGTETSNTQTAPYLQEKLLEEMMRKYVFENISD